MKSERLRGSVRGSEVSVKRSFDIERYRELKDRDGTGWLDDKEFEELLNAETAISTYENPPLHFSFDPARELERIQHLSKTANNPGIPDDLRKTIIGERKAEFAEFEDRLMRQRAGWVVCERTIERVLRRTPDIASENLFGIIAEFGHLYGFPASQKNAAREMVREYQTRRASALALYRTFPSATDLVRELTGLSYTDARAFDPRMGLMTIDIFTDREHLAQLYRKDRSARPESADYQGFQSEDRVHKVYYTVIRAGDDPSKVEEFFRGHESTLQHEQEHATNALLSNIFRYRPDHDLAEKLRRAPEIGWDTSRIRLAVAREQMRTVLDRAKDEILAMKKEGRSTYFDNIITSKGPYNFTSADITSYAKSAEDYPTIGKKVFVDEYQKIVRNAITAFDTLTHEGSYTNDEAVIELRMHPLHVWPRSVERLLELERKKTAPRA